MKELKNFYSRYRNAISQTLGHFYPSGVVLTLLLVFVTSVSAADVVSLKAEEISISSVFDRIEALSDYTIFYKTSDIDLSKKVNVDFVEEDIFQAIDNVLKNTDLTYSVNGKVIIIHEKHLDVNKTAEVVQQVQVTGKVRDEGGEPIPGVSVLEKGTTNGSVTNLDGEYVIECTTTDPTLIYSFMGMVSQEIAVGGQSSIDVVLVEDKFGLEEIVVVGYGTQKKSIVTGSIGSLSSDDIEQTNTASVDGALTGRMAGVFVTPTSGQPGGSSQITIRGVGTNGNSDPLIIVDGLQIDDLNYVNPTDIESIEVLKDATSAAIYGSRAANGVILITTKKGKVGKSTLSYSGYYGIQSAINVPEMLNADQYIQLMKEFSDNDGTDYIEGVPTEPTGHNVNWYDEILEPAPVQDHNITATTSSQKGTALFSLGYRDQKGILGNQFDKSYFKRYSARINASYDIVSFIKVGANINFTHIDDNGIQQGTNGYNPIQYAFNMDPTTPVKDPNSADDRGWGVSTVPYTRMWNPMAFMDVTSFNERNKDRLYGNSYIEIAFTKGLKFKSDFGVDIFNNNSRSYNPIFTHGDITASSQNSVVARSSRSNQWQWENILTYDKTIGMHSFTILGGTTALSYQREFFDGTRNDLRIEAQENDDLWYLNSGDIATVANSGSADTDHTLFSYFGRASYNYAERYMAEFIIRRDGSSRFAEANRYAVFPGVSVGWNIANESFWNVSSMNHLKLRGSWGRIGNERIPDLQYAAIIASDRNYVLGPDKRVITGSSPRNLPNPEIMWETGEQLNFGVDFGFYANKLTGAIDYFDKTTKDLLFLPRIEAWRGNNAAVVNAGEVKNTGWEFELNYSDRVGEFNYSIGGNLTYLKNKVTAVANEDGYEDGAQWNGSQVITRMEEGLPLGYLYGLETNGIFQNAADIAAYTNSQGIVIQPNAVPGDFKWVDQDDNGLIDAEDKTMIGQPWPKFTYGISLFGEYKGIDLTILMSGKTGHQIYAAQSRTEGLGRSNLPSFYMDRWTKEGDDNGVARLSIADPNGNFKQASDFYVYDGDFFRISTLNLGYTIPQDLTRKIKIEKFRLYMAIDNLLTVTSYPFFNPEIGPMEDREESEGGGVDILSSGLDYGMHPLSRTIRFGVNVQF